MRLWLRAISGKYSRDLTKLARSGKLDPVIGRDDEILRVIQVLSRRTKNNPVLIGEAGVGKTAILEGLSQKIADNDVPEILSGKTVVALDLGSATPHCPSLAKRSSTGKSAACNGVLSPNSTIGRSPMPSIIISSRGILCTKKIRI